MEEEYVPQSQLSQYESFVKQININKERDPGPNKDEKDQINTYITNKKEEYLKSDNNKKGEINDEITKYASNIVTNENFIGEISDALTNGSSFTENSYNQLGNLGPQLLDIINKKNKPINKGEKLGYLIDGEFMTAGQIQQKIKSVQLDQDSIKKFNIMRDDIITNASKIQSSEFSEFNQNKIRENVYDNLVSVGNISSLANDTIIGNRTFKNDFKKALTAGTYKDLGVTDDMIVDPTPADNKITSEDADIIFNNISKDEEMFKNMLTDYFTNSLSNNHYTNLSPQIQRDRKMNQYTPQSTQDNNQYTPQVIAYKPGMQL
tara:strand:+ start:1113 stop:2072 length:960 start_codon:yes stop_codon:yes gene_type:complete